MSSALAETCRVRVFPGDNYPGPTVKRRDAAPFVLGDERDAQVLAALANAMRLRSEPESPRLMSWPAVIFELRDADDQVVGVVSWIFPNRLRVDDTGGDVPLAEPEALVRWLHQAAPDAAALVNARRAAP
ncbi:MAG: hypothetical protein WA890_01775 [Micromonospora sp.]